MSNRKYIFTAGLPRAGTTLLGTILKQNPNISASISGPLARIVRATIQETTAQGGYGTECPPEKTKSIIKGIFASYYPDSSKRICINHNRGWPLLLPTVKDLYPESKIILCVRDIGWVLDSFEVLIRKNPYVFTSMFSPEEGINVYTRCETLLNPNRTLGFAYNSVKQALTSEHKHDIMLIEYDNLAKNPEQIIKAVYKFIDEPYFSHDFNNVESAYDEFDEEVKLPGLHKTRKKVQFIPRETVIPPDIWNRVRGMEVWRQ